MHVLRQREAFAYRVATEQPRTIYRGVWNTSGKDFDLDAPVGQWWTHSHDEAKHFAGAGRGFYPEVVLEADHPGEEHLDPRHAISAGLVFKSGTPMNLRAYYVNGERQPIEPRQVTARVAMPAPEEAHDMPEAPFFDRPSKDNPGMKALAPDVWFHASQHDIPEGAHLLPRGGPSSYDSPESRQHGFYDTPNSTGTPFANRRDWVWLENHPSFVEGWANNDNKPNIYLVDPHDGPHPWNGTAQAGWVANGATVKKKISDNGSVPREYYDMYYDSLRKHQK